MAINFKVRKDPSLEGPPRAPFRVPPSDAEILEKMEKDMTRDDIPRVSEFAPASNHVRLRERVEHSTRVSMQERADSSKAVIDELVAKWARITKLYEEGQALTSRLIDAVHIKTEEVNKNSQQIEDAILSFCTVLEQLEAPPPKPIESVEPITEETPTVER